MPDFVLNTIPSGSTRVTVASLYSFPLTVLKSSEDAANATEKIKNVRTLVSTSYLNQRWRFPVLIFGMLRSRRIPGPTELIASKAICLRSYQKAAEHGRTPKRKREIYKLIAAGPRWLSCCCDRRCRQRLRNDED